LLNVLYDGEGFGEIALMRSIHGGVGSKRLATVQCAEATDLLVL